MLCGDQMFHVFVVHLTAVERQVAELNIKLRNGIRKYLEFCARRPYCGEHAIRLLLHLVRYNAHLWKGILTIMWAGRRIP